MAPPQRPTWVLSPRLVVYRDEEIVDVKLKRVEGLIPHRPWEGRPPGERLPRGIRNVGPVR